jgi:hypothetical protein
MNPHCKLRSVRFKTGGELRLISGPLEPAQNVIEILETALEQARSGECQAVAIAKVMSNGHTRHGWQFSNRQQADGHRLVSSITLLLYEYNSVMLKII